MRQWLEKETSNLIVMTTVSLNHRCNKHSKNKYLKTRILIGTFCGANKTYANIINTKT